MTVDFNKYTDFVDKVTSQASKDAEYFVESCEIIEEQGAYQYLDSPPITIAARPHRSAYGSDADYWSKPSADDVYAAVYNIMHEANPSNYPE